MNVRRATRIVARIAIGLAMCAAVLVGTVYALGQGSWEAGLARVTKSAVMWFMGLNGPLLDFWGKPFVWVEANATHAFVGGAFEVRVFELPRDGNPRFISHIAVGGIVHDMTLRGDLLYLAAGDGGLVVLDVSDPAHPEVLMNLRGFGYTFGLALHGDYLYTTERSEGLRIFDVSRPRRPRQIGAYKGLHSTNDVVVSDDGSHLFVADGERGMVVLDVTGPDSLVERSAVALPAEGALPIPPIDPPPLSLQARAGYVYMAAVNHDLVVVDVRDPSTPRIAATLSLPGDSMDVRLHGDFAYLAQEPIGVAVVDIASPAAPRELSIVELPGCPHALALSDGRAVVTLVGQGLALIDLSTPAAPRFVSQFHPDAEARNVKIAGGFAFLARGSGGLETYDLHEPAKPRLVAQRPTRDYLYDVTVDPPYAYLAEGQSGFTILDISDPRNAQALATIKTPEHAFSITLDDTTAYTAEGMYGYVAVDTTDRSAPRIFGFGEKNGYVVAAHAIGDKLALADLGALRLLDMSAPGVQPRLLWQGPSLVLRMIHEGSLLYMATHRGALEIVDLADPDHPVQRGRVSLPGHAYGISLQDGLAAVAGGEDGVWLVDVRDPDAPGRLGHVATRGRAWGVALDGELLYVADGLAGLTVVNVADRSAPVLVSAP